MKATTCGSCKHCNYAEDVPWLCEICENPDSINYLLPVSDFDTCENYESEVRVDDN